MIKRIVFYVHIYCNDTYTMSDSEHRGSCVYVRVVSCLFDMHGKKQRGT